MATPKVSVIIPVYNVEPYIRETLDSVLAQTLNEIEIICIDDGSTDGTPEILKKYAKKDKRMQLFVQENKGAGAARNVGLAHAKGKYLAFLDGDDLFHPSFLEKMVSEAERTKAQVVLCEANYITNNTNVPASLPGLLNKQYLPKHRPFSPAETKENLLSITTSAPWNKLFLKSYIQDSQLTFQAFPNANDVYFSAMALCCAKTISYIMKELVTYRRGRPNSLQNSKNHNPLCFYEAWHAVYLQLVQRDLLLANQRGFQRAFLSAFIYNYNTTRSPIAKKEIVQLTLTKSFAEMGLLHYNEDETINYYQKQIQKITDFAHYLNILNTTEDDDAIELIVTNTTEHPDITVIIPCYQVELYLDACLRSICTQTHENMEIICVDDGSTDGTLDILKFWASLDQRITVIHKKNSGQSSARNVGIAYAKGDYLYYMDSDDLLEQTALEKLYLKMTNENLELVFFEAEAFSENQEDAESVEHYTAYYHRSHIYAGASQGIPLLCEMYNKQEYLVSPCLQMARRDFIENKQIRFKRGIWHEDNLYTFQCMLYANRVGCMQEAFFKRRLRPHSTVTQEKTFRHFHGFLICFDEIKKLIKNISFSDEQQHTIMLLLKSLQNHAQNIYEQLSPIEQSFYPLIDEKKSETFDHIMQICMLKREHEDLKRQLQNKQQELNDLRHSKTFIAGKAVLFAPKKARGFVRCYKQHGLKHTMRQTMVHLGLKEPKDPPMPKNTKNERR